MLGTKRWCRSEGELSVDGGDVVDAVGGNIWVVTNVLGIVEATGAVRGCVLREVGRHG